MVSDDDIQRTLQQLAVERNEGSTFCPSEAARRLAQDWRPLMPRIREVAAEMLSEGRLICTQRGQPAHPLTTRGAIRLAHPPQNDS